MVTEGTGRKGLMEHYEPPETATKGQDTQANTDDGYLSGHIGSCWQCRLIMFVLALVAN